MIFLVFQIDQSKDYILNVVATPVDDSGGGSATSSNSDKEWVVNHALQVITRLLFNSPLWMLYHRFVSVYFRFMTCWLVVWIFSVSIVSITHRLWANKYDNFFDWLFFEPKKLSSKKFYDFESWNLQTLINYYIKCKLLVHVFKALNEFEYYKQMKFNSERLLFLVDTSSKR